MIDPSFITPLHSAGSSIDLIRARVVAKESERKLLTCILVDHPYKEVRVRYGVAPDNYAFNPSVAQFRKGDRINLVDCEVDEEGRLIPSFMVLEPDYLIDASAVAECFQNYATTPLHYFRNKFEEMENRSYLLLGNLANFFLDELIYADDPETVDFNDVFQRSFKHSPFEYASCEDIREPHHFREFMHRAKQQFENIRRVIQNDFPKSGIDIHQCTLEPSFFSEKFGFQGRLDLWQPLSTHNKAAIVELKSGKLPFPVYDREKVALNHEVQTALYRLMIESVYGKTGEMDASILYSAGNREGENLRAVEKDEKLEKAIVNVRNLVVANEKRLVEGDNEGVASLFSELFNSVRGSDKLPWFFTQKISRIENCLNACSELEKSYFYRFTRFVSRELYHQKIGDIKRETPTGVASLWNSTFQDRAEALDVLFDLSILHVEDAGSGLAVRFSRGENGLVNFREGDICIVYPREGEKDTVLNQQILKGSIAAITPNEVVVRFRYKQKNRRYFDENRLWAIEHDALDSSCTSMYKGLFAFMEAPKQKRDLLLGLKAPRTLTESYPISKDRAFLMEKTSPSTFTESHPMENEEMPYPENIIAAARRAKDYFLIVGPPGTGKTSIFARRLIETYHAEPETNIMVLAYTNRAVDELCEAIHAGLGNSNGECDAYIRVGSELSCAAPYRRRLLQQIAEHADDRQSLLAEIDRTRVFVSTLASINGRMELFALKRFHVAIIDEASQILEPQIIGLLPRFDRFVMIGDHHQLSTIVLQDREQSDTGDPLLQQIGITDCRDSLFERLIRRCLEKEWHHAHVQLTRQGRMHEEIAAFPATRFYPKGLSIVNEWQSGSWSLTTRSEHPLHRLVAKERTAFISTEQLVFSAAHTPNHTEANSFDTSMLNTSVLGTFMATALAKKPRSTKINEVEAEVIARLVQALSEVYEENERPFNGASIGIIAPYRNQIAMIRQKLQQSGLPAAGEIMIETVERFQGSQRDIILMSFCVNKPEQLDYLCNMNREGTVDRKLNVAITRARQQLFLVGNARILGEHPIYVKLLEHYRERTLYPASSSF